ncbi:MARVEL domain-containing protein 2 [Liparis tanakae]|uniref:MARVEL domain-containing protein 2 n=1 Tax=Liparis tanakae TaxID=230148 RepID=A0A4Z2IIF6_9TELE|nr:MARVEL domain-containing protein 2 [Liparis tanakae]
MKSWSSTFKRQDPGSVVESSSSKSNSISGPAGPVWVTHTPTPDDVTDIVDTSSIGRTSSTPPYAEKEDNNPNMKDKLKSFIPRSWGGIMDKWTKDSDSVNDSDASTSKIQILPNGSRVSPPVSPLLERRDGSESLGHSSRSSNRPLLRESPSGAPLYPSPQEESLLTSIHPAEYYAEKLEVYNLKYSYLKSWPGLLRLLAGLQLLFGGMVFACIIAYIQKDSEWSNSYGLYNGAYNNGLGMSGYSYRGPMTAFVLAIAGVSWIITLILLVVGMTMYYRTILLDAPWWPLTEAFINVALFLFYMAAGIVYLNDLNRGGLCYTTIGVNPIMANLCRVDGGQMAGTAFIFINMAMYLGSFLVCLKMWRHEAARRETEYFENQPQEELHQSIPLTTQKVKRISFKDEKDKSLSKDDRHQKTLISEVHKNPVRVNRATVSEYTPKVHVIADYIIKYPGISCVEEKEKYKAVFNDQYQEYKDLHRDIGTTLDKFRQLDATMARLLREGKSQEEHGFLEKKERCDYLKAKLSHIKNKIRIFDQEAMEDGCTAPLRVEAHSRSARFFYRTVSTGGMTPWSSKEERRRHEIHREGAKLRNDFNRARWNYSKILKTMYEPRYYDSPPVYSPPYSTNSQSFYPPRSILSPRSQHVAHTDNAPHDSNYNQEKPQLFYRWFSPPGFVKTFHGVTVLMCFLIFACVASTLVWDMNGFGYGGYGVGATGAGGGTESGYYGGSYGYGGSYMTPKSAKSAMISMAAINFLVSLGFLVSSFSRSRIMRGCRFYLTVFICDIILAVLQGIIDIIFVIGVNPMSQSSQSMLYNPMLMMCQNIQGSPSLSGSVGAGFPGGFPMYNQYLHHYCYMDPEETVGLVLGLMVVLALSLSAYFAYKTRSKIWHHGKAHIYWDEPLVRSFPANSNHRAAEPLYQNSRAPVCGSSSSEEADSIRKPPPDHVEKGQRKGRGPRPAAREKMESPYETGYTTGDTGNELDGGHTDDLYRLYPEITSDEQRRQYKKEFDSDLACYKSLCAEMDDISDQMHKLSRELDMLDEDSMKYQGVADEHNRLKVLKRTSDYQAKKKRCKELRKKLFHIKRLRGAAALDTKLQRL